MNKYIYKVRFVTLNFFIATTRTKIKHKHELQFWQITVSTTEKNDCKQIV